ncbi:hypothetical protein GCM10023226_05540 [Nocardioides nanhaiensis]|uniref:Uncharacterized protein n=1 Tax=Nocardioides nanhaiensis TaxID=1476871 RepID=A0ABP8VVM5_9ACTN
MSLAPGSNPPLKPPPEIRRKSARDAGGGRIVLDSGCRSGRDRRAPHQQVRQLPRSARRAAACVAAYSRWRATGRPTV